jgi:putative transposase
VLKRVYEEIGYPTSIRVDQGSEFIPRDLALRVPMKGVTLDLFRSGRPTDNAFIESLNGKFRAECLNQQWFINLDDAVRKCDAWRRNYNDGQPHSAIGKNRRYR